MFYTRGGHTWVTGTGGALPVRGCGEGWGQGGGRVEEGGRGGASAAHAGMTLGKALQST
jgi:hypothetical protein